MASRSSEWERGALQAGADCIRESGQGRVLSSVKLAPRPRFHYPPLVTNRWTVGATPLSLELRDAETGQRPRQATRVTVQADPRVLTVRFDCMDDDPWTTFRRRDDPLWQEEVVEVFLAPGSAVPRRYVELEVSPAGILFDALVANPTGLRRDLMADVTWDCPELRWAAGLGTGGWWASLEVPWESVLAALGWTSALPELWRANFYRVDRPRDGSPPEYSAASPTLVTPADFHRPECFGRLERI